MFSNFKTERETEMKDGIEFLSLEGLRDSDLPAFTDESDDNYYRLKYGHLLPLIDVLVEELGSDLQKSIYQLTIHEQQTFKQIGPQLRISKRYADRQLVGPNGLASLIREELVQMGLIKA